MQLIRESDGEAFAMWGPVLLRVISTAATDRHSIDTSIELFDEMLRRYAAVGGLIVIEHGAPTPSADTLRYVRERYDGYGDRLVMTYAILGLGFWAGAAVRLGGALIRASRHTALLDISLERACERLSLELVGVNAQELRSRAEQLRALVRDRSHGLSRDTQR